MGVKTVVSLGRIGRWSVRQTGIFLGQRQERIAFRAAKMPPGMLAQKENDEGEDQTEGDGQGQWDDGHKR